GRVEYGGVDAEIDQPLDLVNACHAGADDNNLVMGFGLSAHFPLRNSALRLIGSITVPFVDASNRRDQRAARGACGSARRFALRRCASILATLPHDRRMP